MATAPKAIVLDISHHNTVTSFNALYDSGIRGIIHKASQSTGMVDKMYDKRRQAALDAGMLWGAYHFATAADPVAQVKHFIDAADPDEDTLMALDYEPNGTSTMNLKQAKVFLQELDQRLGRKNVLYSGNLIKETLKTKDADGFWSSHPLWLAHYAAKPIIPPQWPNTFLWQFSDGKNNRGNIVNGITGGVDMNHFDGTETDLRKQWVIDNVVVTPSVVENKSAPIVSVSTQDAITPPVTEDRPWWRRLLG
jgi:GH25 family lysozyme M1 (1,4-beta-N-acetylmuramidase)